MGPIRPHLTIGKGSLMIGGISAKSLADEYGTPLYVTDLDRVMERYDSATSSFASRYKNCILAYAYKSNPTVAVVGALSNKGAGATIVSIAGLKLARACGVPPGKVIFDGPSKSPAELEMAVLAGIGMINAESTQEVLDIESLCIRHGVRRCRVGFRVNFGIQTETHAGLATGSREHKFGVPRDDVVRFCKEGVPKLRRVQLSGLHSHIGSQIFDVAVFKQQSIQLADLGMELREHGIRIEEFNFGGGLGFPYEEGQEEVDFDDYARATVNTFVRKWGKGGTRNTRLVFELGRSIVADSTILLTRVNYLKGIGATEWALVDAGMNDFLRPALYGARHQIVPASIQGKERSDLRYNVGGPVCESTDVLARDRRFGVRLTRGDLLAVLDAGAYGISMASQYNMRSVPALAVVSRGKRKLAQKNKSDWDETPNEPTVRARRWQRLRSG